jgi:hypothetical protein
MKYKKETAEKEVQDISCRGSVGIIWGRKKE